MPPNIFFIFTDQQRADTIAGLGNPVIKTPHMDRLAREGTSFVRAYTPSPVCVPARCSLLYGQDPIHTQCADNGHPGPIGRPTYAQLLTQAGYRTHAIGKCHFTPDPYALNGFETRQHQEEIVGDPTRDDYLVHLRASGFGHITDPHGVRGEMYYIPQVAQMPASLHPTQWVGDQATAFIRSHSSDKPWLCYAGIIHPHPPFAPPAPWHKMYRTRDTSSPFVPEEYEALQVFINRQQNRYKYRGQGWDNLLVRTIRAYYQACISFIDFQIGRMIQALEQTGQLDNTLIMLSSDHGEMLGDYRCFGKRSMHDAAARVPLVCRLPGVFEPNARCDDPASLVDVMPTFLSLAGVKAPGGLDGVSLMDLAAGRADRDAVYVQFQCKGQGLYSIVTQDHKFTWSAPDGREFLFDRVKDPLESVNAIDNPGQASTAQALRKRLQSRLANSGFADAVLPTGGWKEWPRLEVPANPDDNLLIQDHPWADQRVPSV